MKASLKGIAALTGLLTIAALIARRRRQLAARTEASAPVTDEQKKIRVNIVFATQRGTARSLAHRLFSVLLSSGIPGISVNVTDSKDYHIDNLNSEEILIFVVATYTGGSAPEASGTFAEDIKDLALDFRVTRDHLRQQKVAVFGLGDMVYGDHFNQFAKDLDHWLRSLGASFMVPSVYAHQSKATTLFNAFAKEIVDVIRKKYITSAAAGEHPVESDDEKEADEVAEDEDIEDLISPPRDELLYPRMRAELTKQGYKLLGSHSGVKLCRWTKSMLRGRGGCYKHTFYNISSFQCMEMTPSLACANKCVFCWRHHTNPVAREFTWKHDTPEFLVEQAITEHRGMIKGMKGVPGVRADRYAEAMNIKHCALSLVGEPIMYPEINKFVSLLHDKHISSFMVTNAQFPDRIAQLCPVTQLYVSIDAPTKDELQRIDRPIFEDFWERYLACIDEMAKKRQRTVFRLTLVGGYNMTNVKEYAELIMRGAPSFVEIKGVTYCGSSDASPLTMKNVPYHAEVLAFCQALETELAGEYQLACEHAHSCCVLMAQKRFKVEGQWHTWIDYAKFFELFDSGRTDFDALEYAAVTPPWALFQSAEQGFDPNDTRHFRKGKDPTEPVVGGC